MPTIRDEAIVLRRWDWSETSQAALLFTREHGLLRGLAKGAKRERGAFSGGVEPLTRGEFAAIVKQSSELSTLTEWDLREVLLGARRSIRGFLAAHYMADIIRHAVHDSDPHPPLWLVTLDCLRRMDTPADIEWSLAQFQWAVLVETGYKPDLRAATTPVTEKTAADAVWTYHADRGILEPGSPKTDIDQNWGIRGQTVGLLLSLSKQSSIVSAWDTETVERANRFLASCLRGSLSHTPPTMERLFGLSTKQQSVRQSRNRQIREKK